MFFKKRILVMTIIPCLIIILFSAFSLYKPISLKHYKVAGASENAPVEVLYKINNSIQMFINSPEDNIFSAITGAAKIWSYFSSNSNLNPIYMGRTDRSMPISYDEVACGQPDIQSSSLSGLVIAQSEQDPDCTGPACTNVWSCETSDKINHFDIIINTKGYDPRADNTPGALNLKTLIAHAFGHAIGLTHCSVGDTASICSNWTSDPGDGSVMYKKLSLSDAITEISEDDREGVVSLYGALPSEKAKVKEEMTAFAEKANEHCPCVIPEDETNPKYMLSDNEISALAEYQTTLHDNNLDSLDRRKQQAFYYQNRHMIAYSTLIKTAENYLSIRLNKLDALLMRVPEERLEAMRQVLVSNIKEKTEILSEFKNDLDPTFTEFSQNELNMLIYIRRAVIDEQERR